MVEYSIEFIIDHSSTWLKPEVTISYSYKQTLGFSFKFVIHQRLESSQNTARMPQKSLFNMAVACKSHIRDKRLRIKQAWKLAYHLFSYKFSSTQAKK